MEASSVLIVLGSISISLIFSNFIIFRKAGQPAWKALIPIYKSYTKGKIANANHGITTAFTSVASAVMMVLLITPLLYFEGEVPEVLTWLQVLAFFSLIALALVTTINFARSFGKSDAFAVGLFLLPVIFTPLLALDDETTYKGPQHITGQRVSKSDAIRL